MGRPPGGRPGRPEEAVVEAGADSAAGAQALPPAMTISGCAPSQDVVADTLDRLRALTTATEVELGSSRQATEDGRGFVATTALPRERLRRRRGLRPLGRPRVAFDATVTLTAPGADELRPDSGDAHGDATTGAGS